MQQNNFRIGFKIKRNGSKKSHTLAGKYIGLRYTDVLSLSDNLCMLWCKKCERPSNSSSEVIVTLVCFAFTYWKKLGQARFTFEYKKTVFNRASIKLGFDPVGYKSSHFFLRLRRNRLPKMTARESPIPKPFFSRYYRRKKFIA